ncbi:transposase [uncultured Oscillibacter sp.]|uniref:transposase n=1 Tax=uncultured Oscillibacter sp. TaxID=876091 RepID=UPI0026706DDC|nr:transposase [uncultured Oscillibacter sp.]
MKQESFSDMEYRCRKKKTKREEFLEIMDEIIPWEEWVSLVVPHYPTGKRGRPPIEIETMLRMYLLQCWFSLSDEGVEDAIYDSYAMRKFMGINFFEQDVPDATTLLHFRHLLEEKGIGKLFFDAINRRPGRFPRVSDNAIDWERYIENRKSAVRCKVEHPYRIVKNIFGFRKAVYRGLRKNLNRLHVLFASANLYMLARAGGSLCPA